MAETARRMASIVAGTMPIWSISQLEASPPPPASSIPATHSTPAVQSALSWRRSGASGISARLNRRAIQPLMRVAPDCEQVEEHAQRIIDQAHAAVWVKIPVDGYLAAGESQPAGDKQRLYVKRHAGQRQALKDLFGCIGPEAFKTALRILQAGESQQAHHAVERAPDQVAG